MRSKVSLIKSICGMINLARCWIILEGKDTGIEVATLGNKIYLENQKSLVQDNLTSINDNNEQVRFPGVSFVLLSGPKLVSE